MVNKIILLGRLTKDPERKALSNGNSVVNFGLATNRNWKTKEGEKKEEVTFHNISAYGKVGDIIADFVKKGHLLYLTGRVENRSWDKEDGTKAYKTEVVVEEVKLMPNRNTQTTEAPKKEEGEVEYPEEEMTDDEWLEGVEEF